MKSEGKDVYQESLKKNKSHILGKFIKVNKYINRPLAFLIVKGVFKTKITPNQITFFSLFLSVLTAFFFSRGTYSYFVVGGLLTQLNSIVDCADGQLARARNQSSKYGSFLDLYFDRIGDFLLMVSISYGYYIYTGQLSFLLYGLITAGLYQLQVNLYYLTKSYRGDESMGSTEEARSLFLLIVMVLAILNRLDLMIYLVLLETLGVCLYRLVNFIYLGFKQDKF